MDDQIKNDLGQVAPTEPVATPTVQPEPIVAAPIIAPMAEPVVAEKTVVENSTPITPTTETTPAEKEIANKLERAKLAMEGPERTAVREEREHDFDVKNKLATIDAKLAEIAKQKEALEITWIKLDENRTGLRKMIDPIVERETKLEVDESQLEEQEKNTVGEKERMVIEQKRWAIQEDRHKAEEEKWVYDSRLFKVEDQIKDNTSAYQKILDEETALLTERDRVERSSI
ncbi:MAG: hypothetical protein WCW56_01905 [Candidatus Paceibacterota bacterium]|jgi:hypothetical protein